MRRLALLAGLALGGCAVESAAPPHRLRIASINPCVDAVLAEVADPATIVGISRYSQDRRATSVPLDWARRFHATSGTAEELVVLRPDVVLAGSFLDPATEAALRRLHVPLVKYPVPRTVEESASQVREIARVAGRPAVGERLARSIEDAARPSRIAKVRALIWRDGGMVLGTGTLADALLDRAGFANQSAAYGLGSWGELPMEQLIARPPALLLSTDADGAARDGAPLHPALRRLSTRVRVAAFPADLMNCGGPVIIRAMARLRAIRASVPA